MGSTIKKLQKNIIDLTNQTKQSNEKIKKLEKNIEKITGQHLLLITAKKTRNLEKRLRNNLQDAEKKLKKKEIELRKNEESSKNLESKREDETMVVQKTPKTKKEQIKYPQSPMKITKRKEENLANRQDEDRKIVKKALFERKLQKGEKDIGSHKRFTNKRNQSKERQKPQKKGEHLNADTWAKQQIRRMEDLETNREKKTVSPRTSEEIIRYLAGPKDDHEEIKEIFISGQPGSKTIFDVVEGRKPLHDESWSDFEKERMRKLHKITEQDIETNIHRNQWYVTCQIKLRKIKMRAMMKEAKTNAKTKTCHRERKEEEREEDGGREALTQTNK